MSNETEIRNHRLEISRTFYSDGVIEICVGLSFLLYFLGYLINGEPFVLGWMPLIFIGAVKKKLTYPRIGYVKLKSAIGRDNKILIAILIVSIILAISAPTEPRSGTRHDTCAQSAVPQYSPHRTERLLGVLAGGQCLHAGPRIRLHRGAFAAPARRV